MTRDLGWWVIGALLAIAAGVGVGLGISVEPVLVALVLLFPVIWLARAIASPLDEKWLPKLVVAAYVAKILGSVVRYGVLQVVYGGVGDAVGYHGAAVRWAPVWRSFQVPDITELTGSLGTRVAGAVTSLVYVPYTPSMLSGFFLFATLAFVGQLAFYAAFRPSIPSLRLKLFAVLLLFMPTMLFWPSSVGKDALMVLCIGVATLGISMLLQRFRLWPLLMVLGSLALAGAIRAHIVALLTGSFVIVVMASRRQVRGRRARPLLRITGTAAAVVLAGAAFWAVTQTIGVQFTQESVDDFVAEQAQRTSQGGSAVDAGAVGSVRDIPGALIRVLFRPLIYEADGSPQLLSALEGTALLGLALWRLPRLLKNLPRIRNSPMLMYALVYVFGFVIAFSVVLNLGIVARQRSQVIQFLVALLVGAGFDEIPRAEPAAPPDETPVLVSAKETV